MSAAATASHYDTLGVRLDADADELRRAYRRAAQRHHPDRLPACGQAQDRMAQINSAYAVLSHPQRRASYDQWMRAREARSRAEAAVAASQPSRFAAGWPWGLVAATMAVAMGTVGMVLYRTALPNFPVAASHASANLPAR